MISAIRLSHNWLRDFISYETDTRKQLERLSDQTKDLTALAQKVATETSEPIKSGVNRMINKAP